MLNHFSSLARFEGIETWIFDLDNTLYPPHADLWPKVDQKITQYIANLLGVDGLTARAIQKYYYQVHGTTLNGLMREHAIDPHAFLDFVHDIDRSSLPPDARLAAAIELLPGRKFIFTNGSRRHAEATIEQLGIAGLFEDIPRNLEIPAELGMRTVLVVPDARGDHKDDWERLMSDGPGPAGIRFDAVTPDLPEFLTELVLRLDLRKP